MEKVKRIGKIPLARPNQPAKLATIHVGLAAITSYSMVNTGGSRQKWKTLNHIYIKQQYSTESKKPVRYNVPGINNIRDRFLSQITANSASL